MLRLFGLTENGLLGLAEMRS